VAKRRDGKRLEMCSRIQKEFGTRFRRARKNAGFLQKTIALEMNLTRTTISNIERGTQRLYLDQVFQAAHVLGEDLHALLPSVADVYKAPEIRTPSDAPLTRAAAEAAQQIISTVLTDDRSHDRKKPRSASRSRKTS
jgi:transcriptional regulator with XRE-family HTH domain